MTLKVSIFKVCSQSYSLGSTFIISPLGAVLLRVAIINTIAIPMTAMNAAPTMPTNLAAMTAVTKALKMPKTIQTGIFSGN